jgi:hypothetical protein
MAHFLLLGFFFFSQGLWLLIRRAFVHARILPSSALRSPDEVQRNS